MSTARDLSAGAVALAAIIAVAGSATTAMAQVYPSKPVRILIGFPPGTAPDTIIRQINQKLGETAGWTMIVENRPGQGGSLAATDAARATPDGYTLLFSATGALATNPALYRNLRYDPVKDFTPITRIIDLPLVLMVNAGSAYKSVSDFVADARARPGTLNYASVGNGSTSHLVMASLAKQSGIQLTHVPYKGSAEIIPALLGGSVQAVFDSIVVGLGQSKAGRARMLGVSTGRRLSALPDVPTLAESGLPGFDMAAWYGVLGPAGLPQPLVNRVNQEFIKAVTSPDLQATLEAQGSPVVTSTPEAFAAFIRSEGIKWGQAVRESGATVD
ncbi:MAG: tripartite tricarboxylate transporter substrate binding protein [Proteobacteria bacterium]|nr:tripartite tricarboxylate transporter substrate binding protein [Burkholderiales bacterium]